MARISLIIPSIYGSIARITVIAALSAGLGGMALAAQDKYTLKAPNGISFSEARGYESWQNVAVSQVEDGLKIIVGNPAMINAYRSGIPANGKHFPDGSKVVKIEWSSKKNPDSPYFVMIPDMLKSVSIIEKDSRRFPQTSGWGYAQFRYDAKSSTFASIGTGKAFGKEECYSCFFVVEIQDCAHGKKECCMPRGKRSRIRMRNQRNNILFYKRPASVPKEAYGFCDDPSRQDYRSNHLQSQRRISFPIP